MWSRKRFTPTTRHWYLYWKRHNFANFKSQKKTKERVYSLSHWRRNLCVSLQKLSNYNSVPIQGFETACTSTILLRTNQSVSEEKHAIFLGDVVWVWIIEIQAQMCKCTEEWWPSSWKCMLGRRSSFLLGQIRPIFRGELAISFTEGKSPNQGKVMVKVDDAWLPDCTDENTMMKTRIPES